MEIIETECYTRDGTGLYSGMCEQKGTAVICIRCNGTGCEKICFKPFVKRRGKRGIQKVSQSFGSFIAEKTGPTNKWITYKEFKQGKMP